MDVSARVAQFLDRIDEHYVLPDRCASIRRAIETRLAAGAYAKLDEPTFAETITDDLRSCSGDRHFKVVHRAEPQPTRQQPTEETPEEIAAFRRSARFHAYGCREVKRLPGNVGYWKIDEFYDVVDGSAPAFLASMQLLAGTAALLVDVRGNTGGDPAAVALACSFFFDVEPVHLNTLVSRKTEDTRQWWTSSHLAVERYVDRDVFVLVDACTASAAEEFAYNLQALGRATIVGRNTMGAAHLREQFQIDPHFFLNVPTQRPVNPRTNANWEGSGVVPDVLADSESALAVAHRMALVNLAKNESWTDAESREIQEALRDLGDEP